MVAVILFAAGVTWLFTMRFEAGDVYPPYSSLRSDPLGTKALYRSLETVKGLSVRRHHDPLSRLKQGQDKTLLFLGVRKWEGRYLRKTLIKDLAPFLLTGGRVVIAFLPEATGRATNESPSPTGTPPEDCAARDSDENPSKPAKDKPKGDQGEPHPRAPNTSTAKHSVGVCFGLEEGVEEPGQAVKVARAHREGLPETLSWHTLLHFQDLEDPWQPLYTSRGHPVIIERPYGRGSLVFSTGSYLFSNEALADEPHPGLLSWFVGKNKGVIFDEAHLGIRNSHGVADLARQYDLHWLFAVMILLFGLFIWKNSLPFIPYHADNRLERSHIVESPRDDTEGLISLLRRHISKQDILGTCLKEWKKSPVADKDMKDPTMDKIKAVIEAAGRGPGQKSDLPGAYRSIAAIISEDAVSRHRGV